jgi:hypothetical protein
LLALLRGFQRQRCRSAHVDQAQRHGVAWEKSVNSWRRWLKLGFIALLGASVVGCCWGPPRGYGYGHRGHGSHYDGHDGGHDGGGGYSRDGREGRDGSRRR